MPDDLDLMAGRLMQRLAEAPDPAPTKAATEDDADTDADDADPSSDPTTEAAATGARRRRPTGLQPVWTMPGIGPMTSIPTMLGQMPAQALRERDLVRTADGEYRPLIRVDRIVLDEEFLSRHPEALPVMIRRDAFQKQMPKADLMLSPAQMVTPVLPSLGRIALPALDLYGRPGVIRKAEAMFTYIILHLGRPATIPIDGFRLSVGPVEVLTDA